MSENQRKKATENLFQVLKLGGIYITFENVIPECEEVKQFELFPVDSGTTCEVVKECWI